MTDSTPTRFRRIEITIAPQPSTSSAAENRRSYTSAFGEEQNNRKKLTFDGSRAPEISLVGEEEQHSY